MTASLAELLAAFGATGPTGLAGSAGLARLSLAGSVGNFPGSSLTPQVLARLACDNRWQRILLDEHGAVLHHGRRFRLATPAQRRALAARDKGCVIPGCPLPPEFCDAHHVIPWTDGGETNIDDMVLLCSRHHTAHHLGVYQMAMRDGIPWVRLPGYIDITRPWLRNTTVDARRRAHQIALDLTQDKDPPNPAQAA